MYCVGIQILCHYQYYFLDPARGCFCIHKSEAYGFVLNIMYIYLQFNSLSLTQIVLLKNNHFGDLSSDIPSRLYIFLSRGGMRDYPEFGWRLLMCHLFLFSKGLYRPELGLILMVYVYTCILKYYTELMLEQFMLLSLAC